METIARADTMEHLRMRLSVIGEAVPKGSQIVYLDYPVYENIGDLLIMKGAEAFFKAYGIRVRRRYAYVNFRPRKIPRDWIIVCQGGGNFGDLYPQHHSFRERIAAAYPDNRIVVLPQTIHFKDAEEEERSFRLFSKHPDFHLFVRDERSRQTAARWLSNVVLCPDMAHQLYPIAAGNSPREPLLSLIRADGEGNVESEAAAMSQDNEKTVDWPDLFNSWDRILIPFIVRCHSLDRRLGNPFPLRRIWYFLANLYTARAIRLFERYETIVTSRLHGHLLACLMGKNNVLVDNSYGKNTGYYRQWTSGSEATGHGTEIRNDAGDLYSRSS
ncbi:polysaccharide pyruvyl transferase family protein [Cohnella sp. GCM10027633]|uniref:polysaccharide pyruvyl transferase family protein n=1 Tax=unclassified Cohnella TaxID=2636738 RepID=UPI003639BFF9